MVFTKPVKIELWPRVHLTNWIQNFPKLDFPVIFEKRKCTAIRFSRETALRETWKT